MVKMPSKIMNRYRDELDSIIFDYNGDEDDVSPFVPLTSFPVEC